MRSCAPRVAVFSLLVTALTAMDGRAQSGIPSDSTAGGQATRCEARQTVHPLSIGDPVARYARMAELLGQAPGRSWLMRRTSSESEGVDLCADRDPWRHGLTDPVVALPYGLSLRPVRLHSELNTAFPYDLNNGAVWAGRGVSTAVAGGVRGRWGRVSIAFEPIVAYQQNRSFRTMSTLLPGYIDEIYHGHPGWIDWPERFGNDAYWTLDPGQSYVRVDFDHVAAGLSTESLWWGPAQRYPLLLSNAGPGFPHIFVRTPGAVDLWGVAELEAEVIWGRVSESRHFDADASNDYRSLAGYIVAIQPRGLPGIRLGTARTRLSTLPPEGPSADHALEPFRTGPSPDGRGALEMTTVFGRWVLAGAGLELYGEVALPATAWAAQPEPERVDRRRALGYTVGGTKVIELQDGWLRLQVELIQLQNRISLTTGLPTATYYVHPEVRHGYTHRGQLLGAAVGPGSEAQSIAVDLYRRWGSIGAFVERVGLDDDAYYRLYAWNYGMRGHDLEITLGLRHTLLLDAWRVQADLGWVHRRNRDFIPLTEGFWAEANINLAVGVSWRPGAHRSGEPVPER